LLGDQFAGIATAWRHATETVKQTPGEEVSARMPWPDEIRSLRLRPGAPVE